MTDHPNLEHVTDKVISYCPTHGHTAFVCLKCQTDAQAQREHDTAMLPQVDLALVSEVQRLRAENERLTNENTAQRYEIDRLNKLFKVNPS